MYTPASLVDAIHHFSDPMVCIEYVTSRLWPNGVMCPRCGCFDVTFMATRRV
jgi:hypothetical protein